MANQKKKDIAINKKPKIAPSVPVKQKSLTLDWLHRPLLHHGFIMMTYYFLFSRFTRRVVEEGG
ncbi:hypothetical protein [Fructobacillus cardui]|uniref:hypothetical protein n=1 Tax=Fructobacillus cardui TaxID=2893170 RepID=UPI0030C7DD01